MSDIIDFESFRKRAQQDGSRELPAVDEVTEIVADQMLRATLLMEMTAEALKAVAAAGLDPARFHIEVDSLDRFFGTDRLYDEDAMFNGVCFDRPGEDWLVRAAVTVHLLDENEADPEDDEQTPFELSVTIFRIAEGMDHWQVLEDSDWDDDGPPEDLFERLDELDDFDDDDYDDFDAEEDHWRSDRTLTMLDISVDTYNALDGAGILTMDELSEMTERAVKAIAGPEGLEEVKAALAQEGLKLRKR